MSMNKKNTILTGIAISLFAGILGGVLGFFGSGYLNSKFAYSNVLLPGSQVGQKEVIIQEAKNVVVEQDTRIEQLSGQVSKSVYGIFRKKSASTALWDKLYGPDEYMMPAVAITSDGWFVALSQGDLNVSAITLVKGGDSYAVDKVIADPVSKVKFLHVKDIAPQVVEFAQRETLKTGQTLVGIDSLWHKIQITNIGDLHFRSVAKKTDYIQSIENVDEALKLLSTGELAPGLPLFNLNGQLVALSQNGNQGVKIAYINALMNGVLKNGKLEKPFLGISYLELTRIPGAPSDSQGIMIVKNLQGIAVRPDSPLVKSVQEGDIITGIEDSRITADVSFADLIFDYKAGSTVSFKILRQGKEFTLEKTIGVK